MVLLSNGDVCEDYIYYGYSDDDIIYGSYFNYINNIDDFEDNDDYIIDDEYEDILEKDIHISHWEHKLMLI